MKLIFKIPPTVFKNCISLRLRKKISDLQKNSNLSKETWFLVLVSELQFSCL